jgi:hypothetical protein
MQKLFNEQSSGDFFTERKKNLLLRIGNINEKEILSDDIKIIVARIKKEALVEPLKINFENSEKNVEIKNRDIRSFPASMAMFSRESTVPVAVVKYEVPITGNYQLLWLQPNTFSMWTYEAETTLQHLVYYIWTMYSNESLPDNIVNEVNRQNFEIKERITLNIHNLNAEASSYNNELGAIIEKCIEERRKTIEQRENIKSKLK